MLPTQTYNQHKKLLLFNAFLVLTPHFLFVSCYYLLLQLLATIKALGTFSLSESWICAWVSRRMTQKVCFDILNVNSDVFCLSASLLSFSPFALCIFLSHFAASFFSHTSHWKANAELQYSSVRDGNHPLLPDNPNLQDAVTPGNGWTCPQCTEVAGRGSSNCATGCDGDGGGGVRRGVEREGNLGTTTRV